MNESKERGTSGKDELPSAVDDAADIMSGYPRGRDLEPNSVWRSSKVLGLIGGLVFILLAVTSF